MVSLAIMQQLFGPGDVVPAVFVIMVGVPLYSAGIHSDIKTDGKRVFTIAPAMGGTTRKRLPAAQSRVDLNDIPESRYTRQSYWMPVR